MPRTSAGKLYTPGVLALAVTLADFPLQPTHDYRADARSPTCGSTITVGIDCDRRGWITALGVSVSACAIGQASAAIMAENITGCNQAWLQTQHDQMESWLANRSTIPQIPSFDLLEKAKDYPARHGAILLPWRAALAALSNKGSAS